MLFTYHEVTKQSNRKTQEKILLHKKHNLSLQFLHDVNDCNITVQVSITSIKTV